MGFDITFHPVDKKDLKYYFFDVVDDSALSESRACELTSDPDKQEIVKAIYSMFPEWLDDMKNFDDSLYRRNESFKWKIRKFLGKYPSKYYDIGPTFGYAAAAIAGFRHPYWYSRGSAISFLIHYAPLIKFVFTPLPRLSKNAISVVTDAAGGFINANYTGSGYIENHNLQLIENNLINLELRKQGPQGPSIINKVFDEDNLRALREAITYAKENNLGLMEASDVVVPISDECATDPNNMRAYFMES